MSERPTPETDAAHVLVKRHEFLSANLEYVRADFARRLERERDAALRRETALLAQVNAFYLGIPESRLLAMTRERDEAREAASAMYVPGEWRCAKCNLTVIASQLNAQDGTVTADQSPQTCPNECGPMWRISERDARKEARALFEKEFDARAKAEKGRDEALAALRKVHGRLIERCDQADIMTDEDAEAIETARALLARIDAGKSQ